MSIFTYPTVEAPTVVKGWVEGPLLRWESLTGTEIALPGSIFLDGITVDRSNGGFVLKNVTPKRMYGHLYGLSEMQKFSTRGWLRFDPFVKVWWRMPGLQKQRLDGSWIPGSEEGWSARTPGRRWDIPGTKGQHWPWTWGRLAKNWD